MVYLKKQKWWMQFSYFKKNLDKVKEKHKTPGNILEI